MKRIKQIDLVVQAILLLFAGIVLLLQASWVHICYLLLAVWQLTGIVYHQVKGVYTGRLMPRYLYHRVVVAGLAVLLLTPLFPTLHFVYKSLWIAIPLSAVLYGYICYRETFRYMIRPLELV